MCRLELLHILLHLFTHGLSRLLTFIGRRLRPGLGTLRLLQPVRMLRDEPARDAVRALRPTLPRASLNLLTARIPHEGCEVAQVARRAVRALGEVGVHELGRGTIDLHGPHKRRDGVAELAELESVSKLIKKILARLAEGYLDMLLLEVGQG